MTDSARIELANLIVDKANELAELIDPEYSREVFESSLSNRGPQTDNERMIWLLHWVAYNVNCSGLCDPLPEAEQVLNAFSPQNLNLYFTTYPVWDLINSYPR